VQALPLFQELKTFQLVNSLILRTHLVTINKNDCKVFAAINTKENSHETSEEKCNYLHFTLQRPRLRKHPPLLNTQLAGADASNGKDQSLYPATSTAQCPELTEAH
jgi:hypothetical protein